MKSTPLIFQDFSIAGIRKQWEWQQLMAEFEAGVSISTVYQKSMEPSPVQTLKKGDNVYTNIGRKCETRRTSGLDKINENPGDWECKYHPDEEGVLITTNLKDRSETIKNKVFPAGAYCIPKQQDKWNIETYIKCPYGVVGDEIWVKEKWKPRPFSSEFHYYFDDVYSKERKGLVHELYDWKNPMHMPKAASRIKLEITGVSIERLRDITEEGALREGLWYRNFAEGDKEPNCKPIDQFINRWKELHGKESLDKNPWVWVIQFTVKEFRNA